MTSIRKLVLALCLAGSFSYSSAQQIDTTGNLINNGNWSGATYGVDPNDCCSSVSGSGALYDTASDTIKFSYGLDTLIQTIGLQQALGGTGVQVHGYNYSFDYRLMPNNALHTDNLTASIWLTTSSGFHTEGTHLFLSGQVALGVNDQWNDISGTRSFASPYVDPQSITMRFEGRDGGFWAGYYGPEVRNVSLSVNYSFDPCASDPLYSSSCPGYLEAYMANLFALLGWGSTSGPEVEIAVIDYSLPTTTSITSMPEETSTGEVKVDAGGIEVSTTGELSVPDGIPEEAREKKPVDMNLISRIVREATDETATMSIVNQSIQDSMSEDANPDASMTNETLQAIQAQTERSQQQAQQEQLDLLNSQIELSTTDGTANQITDNDQNGSFDAAENKDDALQTQTSSTVENRRPIEDSTNKNADVATVNRDAKDNEAAGDVSIDALAQTPADFNSYLAQQMVDAEFYASKDIYRGQVNVDNARALRGLGTDRLHQQMVDQQYNQGAR